MMLFGKFVKLKVGFHKQAIHIKNEKLFFLIGIVIATSVPTTISAKAPPYIHITKPAASDLISFFQVWKWWFHLFFLKIYVWKQ